MATDELIPRHESRRQVGRVDRAPVLASASELASLAEVLYQRVFGVGLLVSSAVTAYAGVLSLLQSGDGRTRGVVACALLLAAQIAAWIWRSAAYRALRRRPALIVVPALAVGVAAFATGQDNEQFFYVMTILLGIVGVAVPLPLVAGAAVVAAIGVAAPSITAGGEISGAAIGAVLCPPIFWLLVQHLARFMLHLNYFLVREHVERSGRLRGGLPKIHVEVETVNEDAADPKQLTERAFSLHDWRSQRPRWRQLLARTDVRLTARQEQTLFYCCDGLSDADVARHMSIGIQQVRRNLSSACQRAGCRTRPQLVAWAVTIGLVP